MNLPPILAKMLCGEGFDAQHWHVIGAQNAPDTELLFYARHNDAILLTCDLDFTALMFATNARKPSIIQVRVQGGNTHELAILLTKMLNNFREELEKGAILTLDPRRARVRLLPLYRRNP
jgi:predicted nuclease of predicted toxin-antitoxin system